MAMICERCKHETYKTEKCNYCGRMVDYRCVKASQKASKIQRLVICKDDWGKMEKRMQYKNRIEPKLAQPAQAKKA